MGENKTLVKTIKKTFPDKVTAGITWFKFIAAINNLKLAKRELELLAFINYRGTISSSSSKDEFCKMFDSSPATVTNMAARLVKQKLLIKERAKIKVNPALRVDFTDDFVVRFFINVKKEENGN